LDLRFLQDEDECVGFGSMMVKSRSSDSFTSQLKDFIRPIPVNLTNCGSVIIRKQTIPDEYPNVTEFGYESNIVTDPVTVTDFSLTDDGVETINNVVQGSYTVTELAPPAGYNFDSVDCSASTGVVADTSAAPLVSYTIDDPTDVLDCTYFNDLEEGALVIHKDRKHAADGPW
jgi:Prealbumin-like fold domain